MATALEQGFIAAVRAAQGVSQVAYAAAFATYAPSGFGVPANFAAYQAAIVAADNAYAVSVNSAATTAGISSSVVEGNVPQGQIYGNWASILT